MCSTISFVIRSRMSLECTRAKPRSFRCLYQITMLINRFVSKFPNQKFPKGIFYILQKFASKFPNQKFPKGIFYILQKFASTLPNQKFPKGIFAITKRVCVSIYCILNLYTTNIKTVVLLPRFQRQSFQHAFFATATAYSIQNNLLPNVCIFVSLETIVSQ